MVSFPNCKINIGLRIVNKRVDGFHDLETIFYPLGIRDALEVVESPDNTKEISWSQTGAAIPGAASDNLCIKAYHLLKKDFPTLPAVNMHLHKAIPMGAGLGGGSADAAFILQLLNTKFQLGASAEQLSGYALGLGSDCPFFLHNRSCYATGRGEILEEISLDLSVYKILLVNPGIHINTGWAFSHITPAARNNQLKELVQMPVESWQQHIHNDFESPVFEAHPEIALLKASLLENGALYSAMSGSGSSVFGIFEKKIALPINFPAHYFYKWV